MLPLLSSVLAATTCPAPSSDHSTLLAVPTTSSLVLLSATLPNAHSPGRLARSRKTSVLAFCSRSRKRVSTCDWKDRHTCLTVFKFLTFPLFVDKRILVPEQPTRSHVSHANPFVLNPENESPLMQPGICAHRFCPNRGKPAGPACDNNRRPLGTINK